MAIANISLEELPEFGRRLMGLARKKHIGSLLLVAEALYENCHDLEKKIYTVYFIEVVI